MLEVDEQPVVGSFGRRRQAVRISKLPTTEQPAEVGTETPPPKPRNKGGRPRKDTTPTPTVIDAPNPPFTKYYSDHRNPPQRTSAAWGWWNKLTDPVKNIIVAHVYRDWPVLLDPPEGEYKYIDVIIGTDPIQNDQDFIDKYGAGKYHVYLNANPDATGSKRTLFTAFIDGSHDTTKYPPCDKRIQNIDNISLTDPANAAFVAALRASGKLKDQAKEDEEMSAGNAVIVELVKDLAEDRRELRKTLTEKNDQPPPFVDPPPSAEEKLNESLTLLEKLQKFTNGSPSADPMAMMKAVVDTAQVLIASKDNSAVLAPMMEKISALESQLRTQESEALKAQLTEIKDQLRTLKETPPASNVLLPDGSNLDAVVKRAVEKAVESGLGESDSSWWVGPLKQVAPFAIPAIMQGLAQMFLPKPATPASFPMPPGTVTQQQPQQAQLPPPAQPQPQPVQQPPAQQGNAEQLEVERILTAISAPVIEALTAGDSGEDFADWLREEYGAQAQRLIAKFEEDQILAALYVFPLIAPRMAQFPQDRVKVFVTGFKSYDRDKYEAKMDATAK